MYHHENYRQALKSKLLERISANSRYSLRAFARDLETNPSRISEILSGKQGLSLKAAQQFSNRLGFTEAESRYFCDLVLSEDSRSKKERDAARKRLLLQHKRETKEQILATDAFNVIKDWFHFAIIDLLKTSKCKSDPAWIAKRLGLSELQAKEALERLLRLKLILLKNKLLIPTDSMLFTSFDIPSEAHRNFHRQVIEKSLEALSNQNVEEREFISSTVTVSPTKMSWIKEKIRSLNREIVEAAENSLEPKTEVYALSTQFFRLTIKDNTK